MYSEVSLKAPGANFTTEVSLSEKPKYIVSYKKEHAEILKKKRLLPPVRM